MDFNRLEGVELWRIVKLCLMATETLYEQHGSHEPGIVACPICKMHQELGEGLEKLIAEKDARQVNDPSNRPSGAKEG